MADRVLLRGGRVLTCDGDPDEQLAALDVLVEGERITRVAPDLPVEGARVVELRGATVLPGLADAHVHTSWPLDFVFDHKAVAETEPAKHALDLAAVARTFVESGYTLVVGAGTTQEKDDLLLQDAIGRGLLPGPRIVPSGPMIAAVDGLGGDGEMMEVAGDAAGLRAVVRRQCEMGVKALKVFISGDGVVPEFPSEDCYMDDEMLSAAVEEADRFGAFLTVHARGSKSVAMAARTGVRIVHHACFLDDEALSALEARGRSVWVCPGLHYLHQMVGGAAEPWGITADKIERSGYPRELESQVDGLKKLRAAGVPLLSGGDFGHQWTRHGTYAAELQRYVELVDMTPVEAVLTATRNAGEAVGLEVGQVREGYLADLLVVDGDPTRDVTVLQDPLARRFVLKGGTFAAVNPALYP